MEKVNSIKRLKILSKDIQLDCFIALNFGAKSSKSITYNTNNNLFDIHNEIDDTFQTLTFSELYSESNIGEAIDKGALWTY